MNKLGAIVRYELLMAWRRRSLLLLPLLLAITVVGFGLIWKQTRAYLGDFDFVQNTVHLSDLMLGEMVILGVSAPLLLGDTIPLDRQFGVRELLDALPISSAIYLGGKLLSVWVGVIVGVPLSGAVGGALLYAIWEGFDARAFAALWSTLIPLGLTITTIAVLVNVWSRSRRQSVYVGLLLLTPILVLVVLSVMTLGRVAAVIDPAYAYKLNIQGWIQASPTAEEIGSGIVTMLALDAIVVVVVWTYAWVRQRALSAG